MALLLGLLLLASLSVLALAAASDSQLQLRIAGNFDRETRALQAARSAGAWAEQWLLSLAQAPAVQQCVDDCTAPSPVRAPGVYPQRPEHAPETWWLDHGAADGIDPLTGARLAPAGDDGGPAGRWIVEQLQRQPREDTATGAFVDVAWYRVIARAPMAPSGPAVVVESLVARPWGAPEWSDPLPRSAKLGSFCSALWSRLPCGRQAWRRRQ
jgi:hypothetical protein